MRLLKKNGTLNEFRLQPVIGPISGFPPAERQPEFISSFFFPSALLQRKRRSPSYYKPQRRRLRTLISALATLAIVLGQSDYFAWLLLDFLVRGSPKMQLWCRNIPDERATAWLRVSLGLEGRAEESAAVNHRGVLDL